MDFLRRPRERTQGADLASPGDARPGSTRPAPRSPTSASGAPKSPEEPPDPDTRRPRTSRSRAGPAPKRRGKNLGAPGRAERAPSPSPSSSHPHPAPVLSPGVVQMPLGVRGGPESPRSPGAGHRGPSPDLGERKDGGCLSLALPPRILYPGWLAPGHPRLGRPEAGSELPTWAAAALPGPGVPAPSGARSLAHPVAFLRLAFVVLRGNAEPLGVGRGNPAPALLRGPSDCAQGPGGTQGIGVS